MSTITSDDAVTARSEPQQAPGVRACPSCARFAKIVLSIMRERLDEIAARDEASTARAAALRSKDGAR
jgi:hypothetical protein